MKVQIVCQDIRRFIDPKNILHISYTIEHYGSVDGVW